jgi:cytosine/adenosine deaminase-related metal-dependent hydrolase
VDSAAADEIEALESRGCLRPNTVLVHGVAVAASRWSALFAAGVSVVWCPASNLFLFGRTIMVPALLADPAAKSRICLGTDSRLTGSRDLLEELRVARSTGVEADDLLPMVTSTAADVLRITLAGRIARDAAADFVVLPAGTGRPGAVLANCERSNLDLVVRSGTPVVGSIALAGAFAARDVSTAQVVVDEREKLAESRFAARIEQSSIEEPGVVVLRR